MVKKLCILSIISIFLVGCYKNSPDVNDGNLSIKVYVKYESQPLNDVPVTLESYGYTMPILDAKTDSNGIVEFYDIPFSQYIMKAKGEVLLPSVTDPDAFDTMLVNGAVLLEPENEYFVDTLQTIVSGTDPGIKINEIYSAGPPNSFFYFYDQYIELYNSSDETLYLDGMVICRMNHWLAGVTYIFQFPGEPMGGTQDYPILPGEFKVIAQDAMNHRDDVFGGETSVDLSNADFEFRNSEDLGDFDNPDVPNIDNIEDGHHLDFFMGVTGDIILIADGSDLEYIDGIDAESVVDCVEFSSKEDHEKQIEDIVDRGFAGVGMSKYSLQSIERIAPGFDSNNSTLDFEILDAPTPGYQHE